MVSFCRQTFYSFRNSSQQINGLTPAQVYNMTFDFNEIFVDIGFNRSNDQYKRTINLTDEKDQNKYETNKVKTISNDLICYHFKHPYSRQLKYKRGIIYKFWLYHQNDQNSIPVYFLFLTSDINYPNLYNDNLVYIFGNNFFN